MDDYTKDFVTLLDEEGKEHNFELLDIIQYEGANFFALLPKKSLQINNYTENICEYYIFKEVIDGNEQILVEVEDPVMLEKISDLLEEKLGNTECEFS